VSDEAEGNNPETITVTLVVVMVVALIVAVLLIGDDGPSQAWCDQQRDQITRDQQLTGSGQERRLHDWTEICK
jgi:hypothetical protein